MSLRIRAARSLVNAMQKATPPRKMPSSNFGTRATPTPPTSNARQQSAPTFTAQAEMHGLRNPSRTHSLRSAARTIAIGLSAHAHVAVSGTNLCIRSWDEFDDT